MKNYKIRICDFAIVSAIVFCGMLLAQLRAELPHELDWLQPDHRTHLGAEYHCIAKAISEGRGFSDPFHEATGVTSWMPPVLPYLMAGAYWLSENDRSAVVQFMLAINALAVLVTGMILLNEARRLRLYWIAVSVFLLGCAANFHELFQKTHDSGWLLLLVGMQWVGLVLLRKVPLTFKVVFTWGLFGGLCALSSPVIGAVWGLLTAWQWVRGDSIGPIQNDRHAKWQVGTNQYSFEPCDRMSANQRVASYVRSRARRLEKSGIKRTCVAALVSIFVILPWTIRNFVEFGTLLPIKSNSMYELWQSQCFDDDGILDMSTLEWQPWGYSGDTQRQQYAALGETAFIHEKRNQAFESILADPGDFFSRMGNRFLSAAIYYVPADSRDEQRGGGWPILVRRIIFPLPLLALLLVFLLKEETLEPQVSTAAAICCLALLPYVVVSYYDRYAAPIVGMKMLLVLYAGDSVRRFSTRGIDALRTSSTSRFP